MRDFQTQYNYFIFFGRIAFALFFLFMTVISVVVSPYVLESENYSLKMIIGIPVFILLMGFLAFRFTKLIFTQSYNFKFEKGVIFSVQILSKKESVVMPENIKGFSTSTYPTKLWDFKVIILYFVSGKKIELPQFLYFNFKEIEDALIRHSIKNLGYERYKWKFFDSRTYEHD